MGMLCQVEQIWKEKLEFKRYMYSVDELCMCLCSFI